MYSISVVPYFTLGNTQYLYYGEADVPKLLHLMEEFLYLPLLILP